MAPSSCWPTSCAPRPSWPARLGPSVRLIRILVTNGPYFVGAGWAGSLGDGADPVPSARYLDRRPALVPASNDNVVLAAFVRPGLDAHSGSHVLALRLIEILRQLRIRSGMSVHVTYLWDVGHRRIYCTPDRELNGSIRRRVLDQLLQPGLPLPDRIVETAREGMDDDAQKIAPRLRLWERADDGARPAEAEPVESARRIQRADRVASDAPGRARTGGGTATRASRVSRGSRRSTLTGNGRT